MQDVLGKLKALAEPTRLRIVSLLYRGELTVTELVTILGQSQPRVSRHLKLLVDAGLAERLPEGAWVFYRLSKNALSERLAALIGELAASSDQELQRDIVRLEEVKQTRATAAAEYFEAAARDWERIRALQFSEEAVEDVLLKQAGPGPFYLHLDVGTGTGRMLELFAERARDGIGIDLSHEMLTVARSNIAKAGLSDRFVRQADASALPVESNKADLVTIHQVLHYLDNPRKAIEECVRVLAPGGSLLIVDFASHSLEFLREEHHHRHLGFEDGYISSILSKAGLKTDPVTTLRNEKRSGEQLTVQIWSARKSVSEPTELEIQTEGHLA